MPDEAQPLRLRRLINGYQVSQAIHVAATLGIADLLAGGPRGVGDLATAVGADEETLYRLLRALAAEGVFHEEADRIFALTPLSEFLRSDVPASFHGWAAQVGRPYYWQAWSNLLHSVRTGENAFSGLYGEDIWTYREQRPEENAIFNGAMTSLSGMGNAAILQAYDFGGLDSIADIAGGQGALLAAILQQYPTLTGVLFDRPHVVSGAAPLLTTVGVANRCRVVSGSFFESVPEGCGAYMMKMILHDWDDERSIAILRVVRAAARRDSRLLVIDAVIGPPNTDAASKFQDLNMLVGPGGRERTEAEFASLFEAAGFKLTRAVPAGALHIVEAEAV